MKIASKSGLDWIQDMVYSKENDSATVVILLNNNKFVCL